MRIPAAVLCLVSLLAAAPATAQPSSGPVLQVAGPATPGAIVSVNLAQATPGALAVAAFGYVPRPTPVGSLATLGIAPAGVLVLGPVPAEGSLFSGLRLPAHLPPVLNGLRIYFQGATLRPLFRVTGPEVVVKVTQVESIVLEVPGGDPTGTGDA